VQGAGVTALCLAWWACFLPAGAQTGPAPDNTELAKQSENPVTRLYTVPLRYEGGYDYGPTDGTRSILELDQAVVPFRLSDDWSLITRTKVPYYWQPPKKLGETWQSGLGNAYTTLFLSPEYGRSFYWGVGPVIYFPTATNSAVGVNKWGSGPSVAFTWKNGGPWVAALVTNNIWSFGGPPQSSDRTNSLLVNPIVSYHFGDGWSVGSSPNITSDWNKAAGKRWTAPVGGGVSKVVKLGRQPVKFGIDVYDDVVHPQGTGPLWSAQFTVTLLFAR
jgi:hypothetical protein